MKLRIGIATMGRFHVLDLARELDALGHTVVLYSCLPHWRAENFGLPRRCHRTMLPWLLPFIAWQRYFPNLLPKLLERLTAYTLNYLVRIFLEPCDVFICMSGMYLEAAVSARRRYGALIVLERGSRHILSQRHILEKISSAALPSDFVVRREMAGYELADKISIPSRHVLESFLEYSQHASKTMVNPYGVDLRQFPTSQGCRSLPRKLLFVGAWSVRKGADLLLKAASSLPNVTLLHVGSVGDLPLSQELFFQHVDSIQQQSLTRYYAEATLFVLASREDGFGMVLVQALASGLPVVCTNMTGGADLAHSPALAGRIRVVPTEDVEALRDGIVSMLDDLENGRIPPLSEIDRQLLSWRAYGERYEVNLQRAVAGCSDL